MKGDSILLGAVAVAILAIPASAILWSGQPLIVQAAAPVDPGQNISQSSGASQSMAFTPPASSGTSPEASGAGTQGVSQPDQEEKPRQEAPETALGYRTKITSFKILNRSTGVVAVVPVEEYVRGAIAAEMPADYHLEALKAQGVAALSYAFYEAEAQRTNPDPELGGADFAADPENRKGYMTEAVAR